MFAECRFSSCAEGRCLFMRVTLAHCHCSPALAMIYWLQNAGQPDDTPAFVHGATRDRPPLSLCPSLLNSVNHIRNKHTHIANKSTM